MKSAGWAKAWYAAVPPAAVQARWRHGGVGRLSSGLGQYCLNGIAIVLIGAGLFSVLDVNDPDGMTAVPALMPLLSFAIIVNLVAFLVLRAVVTIADQTVWRHLAAGQLTLFVLAVVWYRVFWLPSIYVTQQLADHFTYLAQADLLEVEIWQPARVMNSLGMSLLISWLFNSVGRTSFYIIAINAAFLSWAGVLLADLLVCTKSSYKHAGRMGLAFHLLPLTVLATGVVSKDALALFGVVLWVTAFGKITVERFSLGRFVAIGLGVVVVLLTRAEYGLVALTACGIPLFAVRKGSPRRRAVALMGSASILVLLLGWGLVAVGLLEDPAVLLTNVLEAEPGREYSEARILRFVQGLAGAGPVGVIAAVGLSGVVSWLVPFPSVTLDETWVLHVPYGLANLVSLSVILGAIPAIKSSLSRLLRAKANIEEALCLGLFLAGFVAVGFSQAPIPRYRFPLEYAALFFFGQRRVAGALLRGMAGAAVLTGIGHVFGLALRV